MLAFLRDGDKRLPRYRFRKDKNAQRINVPGKSSIDELEETADDEISELANEEPEEDTAPASAGAKASAAKFLQLLVEEKGLALHKQPGVKLIEAVGRALESTLPLAKRTELMVDAIVDSEDVDELFLDDDKLAKFVRQW